MSNDKDQRQSSSRRRRRERSAQIVEMVQPVHNIPLYELMDEEGVQLIHQTSLKILSEVGMDFYHEEARSILKENGVDIRGETAFFDPAVIEKFVSKAPSQFTLLARNADNNLTIGGNRLCFAPVYGPPFVTNLDQGRREATLEDFQNFVKLAYLSPYIHHSGGTIVEPVDRPVPTRHLDMIYSHVKYSDKAFMGSVTSARNAADSVSMAEIVFGADRIRENPALISLINISSPRRLDETMLGALTVYARARQAVIITPFILSGAMAPASVAGTLVQQNAEALAGIAYAQMVEPGTPIVYGSFMTNVDLQTGAPVFGTPSSQLGLLASAQMARHYHLPFRSGGMFASSKIPDAQAAYESVMTMLPTMQACVNFVLHAAGWLENGMTAGYEKFVLDCEMLGMFHKLLQGLDLSEEALALESIRDVPPGGHYLGTPHTIKNFRTAFYRADVFDYNVFDEWVIQGSQDSVVRANKKYKRLLDSYQAPALDSDIDEALQDFIRQHSS